MNSIVWRVHPIKHFPVRGALAAVAMFSFGGLAGTTDGVLMGFFYVLLLFAIMARAYFPTTYRIDDYGIHANFFFYKKVIRWDEISWTAASWSGHGKFRRKEFFVGKDRRPHFSMLYGWKGIGLLTFRE